MYIELDILYTGTCPALSSTTQIMMNISEDLMIIIDNHVMINRIHGLFERRTRKQNQEAARGGVLVSVHSDYNYLSVKDTMC